MLVSCQQMREAEERLFATGREGKAELDLAGLVLRRGAGPWEPVLVV